MCQLWNNMKRAFVEGLRQGTRDGSGSSRRVQRRVSGVATPVDFGMEFIGLLKNPKILEPEIMAKVAAVLEESEDPIRMFALLEQLALEHRPSLAPAFNAARP